MGNGQIMTFLLQHPDFKYILEYIYLEIPGIHLHRFPLLITK